MSLLKFQCVSNDAIKPELLQWAESLGQQSGIVRAYVFGSYARGSAHVESDLDLAVIITEESIKGQLTRPLRGKVPLDFVVITQEEFQQRKDIGGICATIQAEGIEIYPQWQWGAW